MGHELKLRGVSDGTFVAGLLANENNCSIVESIHEDYLDAGCDVITTNSFVAVRLYLQYICTTLSYSGSCYNSNTILLFS